MRAIILAAGRTHFAKCSSSKPKCLYHVQGETLLERQVRILREVGIKDIRIVVGYKKEMIEKINEEKNLGLEIVYNPSAESDRKVSFVRTGIRTSAMWIKGSESVKLGLQGVADDIFIFPGDVFLQKDGVKKVLDDEHPIIWGVGPVFKISREKLPLLRKHDGVGVNQFLRGFCMNNKGVKITETGMFDIDFHRQTDESKRSELG